MRFCADVFNATAFMSFSRPTRSGMIDWRDGIMIAFTPPIITALASRCSKRSRPVPARGWLMRGKCDPKKDQALT
jgi:hypothetical protein